MAVTSKDGGTVCVFTCRKSPGMHGRNKILSFFEHSEGPGAPNSFCLSIEYKVYYIACEVRRLKSNIDRT